MHLKILIGVLTLEVALAKPQSADVFGKDVSDLLPKDPTSGVFNTYIINPSTGQSSSSSQEIIRPSLTTIFQLFRPMISLTNPSLLHLNTNPWIQSPGSINDPGTVTTDNRFHQTNVTKPPVGIGLALPPQASPTTETESSVIVSSSPSVSDSSVQTNPSVSSSPVQTEQPEVISSSSISPPVSNGATNTTSNDDEDYYSYNYKDDDDD